MRLFQLQNSHNMISNDTWDKTFLYQQSHLNMHSCFFYVWGHSARTNEPSCHHDNDWTLIAYNRESQLLVPILLLPPSMLVGVLESPAPPQILPSGADKIAWHKYLFGRIAFDQLIHFFNSTFCWPGFENLVHLYTVVYNSKIKRHHNYSTMMIHLINYRKFVKLKQWCGEVCNDIETCLHYSVDDIERHYIVLRFENIPLSVI